MADILKLFNTKETARIRVIKAKDYIEFCEDGNSSGKRFVISSDDNLLSDIKNYLSILMLKKPDFFVYLKPELFRKDSFSFEKGYEKYAKRISFWEIVKKYECEPDDIYVAHKVFIEDGKVIADCYTIKKELLNELEAIFGREFNRVARISPETDEEANFLGSENKNLKKLNNFIFCSLVFVLIFILSSKKFLEDRDKAKDLKANNGGSKVIAMGNISSKEIIHKKRKAVKNIQNIVTNIKKLPDIMTEKSWIEEYTFFNGEGKIRGLIEGDYDELLNRIKEAYPAQLIKIESIKDEGNNMKSFCFVVSKK